MSLLLFLLACYGVTNIVTAGKIFAPLRAALERWAPAAGYWIRCPMCFGFAVGIFWAACGLWLETRAILPLDWLAAGAVSSGWCWAIRVILHRLGEDAL
jgi:hypothetical protein